MPKPMKVMVEVEEIAHGRLFRLLDGMAGVVSITPVGDGPRATANGKTTGKKQGGAQTAPCVVLGALYHRGKVMTREQLYPELESAGKSRNSLPDTLAKLKQAGEIRASGSGKGVSYRITSAGKKRFETACTIQQPAKEK